MYVSKSQVSITNASTLLKYTWCGDDEKGSEGIYLHTFSPKLFANERTL